MVSFRTVAEKELYDKTQKFLKEIITVLEVNFTEVVIVPTVEITGDPTDFELLSKRLLLLPKISYYLSIMQGDALELQKQYKAPELYGLYEKISELNKAVNKETDNLRSVLSSAKEQIRIR